MLLWFWKAGFWVFETLDGPLGLILAPSWADLVPRRSPKKLPKFSKSCQENNPNDNQKLNGKNVRFGTQNGPQNCKKIAKNGVHFWNSFLEGFGAL